jgi:excinuclease UvrABC ATPase subunit
MALVSPIYSPEGKTETRKTRGRKDAGGQSSVIKHSLVLERETELMGLATKAAGAKTEFAEAVKACAEASGYNAAAVRKYILSRVGEKFDVEKQKIEQLSLIFGV